jgi:hypothetical protein
VVVVVVMVVLVVVVFVLAYGRIMMYIDTGNIKIQFHGIIIVMALFRLLYLKNKFLRSFKIMRHRIF